MEGWCHERLPERLEEMMALRYLSFLHRKFGSFWQAPQMRILFFFGWFCLFIPILCTYFVIYLQFSIPVNVMSAKKTSLTSPHFMVMTPRSIVIKASPLRTIPSPPSKLLVLYLEKTQISTLPPLHGISLKATRQHIC